MTAFPTRLDSLYPTPQLLESGFIKINALGVIFRVPVAGFNKFSVAAEGDFGSGVVEVKRVLGGGAPIAYTSAKTLIAATPYQESIDVSGVSEIVFEVTTAQADGHIQIYTIAERF